jgi:hypothetical protein
MATLVAEPYWLERGCYPAPAPLRKRAVGILQQVASRWYGISRPAIARTPSQNHRGRRVQASSLTPQRPALRSQPTRAAGGLERTASGDDKTSELSTPSRRTIEETTATVAGIRNLDLPRGLLISRRSGDASSSTNSRCYST